MPFPLNALPLNPLPKGEGVICLARETIKK